MQKVKVKIMVADREYPMMVSPDEEEILRSAGKKINNIIKEFEEKYSVKDKQDGLAMCALQYVAKSMTLENNISEKEELLTEEIDKLTQQINQRL
ncbi:cell division protein ZapA [Weeksellaceae bacterium TAE3-ERU29]|nr:cell division protein ZapA [Weeksellaceae bacterium TAE3-ERU29]